MFPFNIFQQQSTPQPTEPNLIKEPLDGVFRSRNSNLLVLPGLYRAILEKAEKLDFWIAGGAALALFTNDLNGIKDWDLFFKSQKHLDDVKEDFIRFGFVEKSNSDWSITLEKSSIIVQLVNRHFYNNVEDIFGKFDFTICCFAIEGKNICYTKKAKEDTISREYNFIFTENLPTCIKRIARYGSKGYVPSTQFIYDISKIFKQTSFPKLKKQRTDADS